MHFVQKADRHQQISGAHVDGFGEKEIEIAELDGNCALVAAQIRAARLAAISRNARFRVVFECPVPGAVRMLEVTGTPAIDDAADRCTTDRPNDGPAVYMPPDVWFGGDAPPTLEVNGRGEITALGATMPRTITVNHGSFNRNITVTAAGRVLTPTS